MTLIEFDLERLMKHEKNLHLEKDYILTHAQRYRNTFDAFYEVFLELKGGRVAVLGGTSSFERYIASEFGFELIVVAKDVRHNWGVHGEKFDSVFCFEVIEHLPDIAHKDSLSDVFVFSGMLGMLEQSHTNLKAGGSLLITTPNSINAYALGQIIHGMNPMRYAPHVRELNPQELDSLLVKSGFRLERIETKFSWGNPTELQIKDAMKIIKKYGGSLDSRGDNIYCIARKS